MPHLSYERDVPDAPNNPSVDQPDMKLNTNSNDSIWTADHFGFNDNKGGRHQQLTLTNRTAPGIAEGDGALYANLIDGQSWPIWQNALGSTTMVSSATNASINGFASLPGGLMIQWGTVAGSSLATVPVSFNTNFRLAGVNTNAYNVNVIPIRAATSPGNDFATAIVTGSVTHTGFSIANIGAHTMAGWYWTAIGPKT